MYTLQLVLIATQCFVGRIRSFFSKDKDAIHMKHDLQSEAEKKHEDHHKHNNQGKAGKVDKAGHAQAKRARQRSSQDWQG